MANDLKTISTSVKIPKDIHKKLVYLAKKDERRLHGYIVLLLKRHCEGVKLSA